MGYTQYKRAQAGEPIKASAITALQDYAAELASEGLPHDAKKLDWRSGKIYVVVPCDEEKDLTTFESLMVGGWCDTNTQRIINSTLTQGITLLGLNDNSGELRISVVVLDTVRKNAGGLVVKGFVPGGIIPGFVSLTQAGASSVRNHCTLDPRGRNYIYTNFGEYAIVARADGIDERGDFCALVPDVHGHVYGKVVGQGRTGYYVNVDNCETQEIPCPLLNANETMQQNTRVVCSRNIITGAWQIISASCPT